jgi:homopolymeric O-antigen transport system ATP-binding protein
MSVVIEAYRLGKKYQVRHTNSNSYPSTFKEAIAEFLRGKRRRQPSEEEFWALKDINFEIQEGERVGIIGRNGAGKSTLLKILSMITEPTTGKFKIVGRVGSLLEVGTGFHPELTGRENIFLNGAILGMSRTEMLSRFDDIVSFAEVERFLDTPIKRYSSGMSVRLAFAVAAHLNPEIVIVDEVLAVGDLQFQRKCIGKMNEAGREGRTVLFVSHNMQAVKQLCTRGIVLQGGSILFDGSVDSAIEQYVNSFENAAPTTDLAELIRQLPADPVFRLTQVQITQEGKPFTVAENGKPLQITAEYDVLQKVTGLRVYVDLCDSDNTLLLRTFHDERADGIQITEPGHYRSEVMIPGNLLGPITYNLIFRATIFNVRSCTGNDGIRITVPVENTGDYNKAYMADTFRGKFALPLVWKTEKLN